MHRYKRDKQTNVRRTVGYHIPCKSAGELLGVKRESGTELIETIEALLGIIVSFKELAMLCRFFSDKILF